MTTMHDIAEAAGVARSTVSAVLSNKPYCYVSEQKRQKILDIAKNLNYSPNQASRALQGLPTKVIGIISSFASVQINSKLVYGLNTTLWNAGYQVMLGDSRSEHIREEKLIREFISRGVDGLIIQNSLPAARLEEIIQEKTVYIRLMDCQDAYDFAIDKHLGGYLATRHLREHGCERIAFMTSSIANRSNQQKFLGYRQALDATGIEFDDGLLLDGMADNVSADFPELIDAIKKLGVDALVCTNDFVAARAMQILKADGLSVPEDVAVIGFDDLDFTALLDPPLTTVHQPVEELAREAVELLFDRIGGETTVKACTLSPRLVIRRSCGCNC
jgi:DNA-binding LacI/PurR family transcriptional regulator